MSNSLRNSNPLSNNETNTNFQFHSNPNSNHNKNEYLESNSKTKQYEFINLTKIKEPLTKK